MIINNKSKATIIISLIIFSLIIPILPLGSNNGSITDNFLFIKNVEQENYEFVAEGACYIIIEVEDIGVTHFYLDQEYREVSYGMNIFSEDFGNSGGHNIEINESNLQYFKSIIVEPLFLKEGEIQVDLDIKTEINFLAGGPISILLRTNFSYDSLYVGLNNSDGEYTMFKRTYATDDYPEIDPLFYSLFFEQGTYIRYDIFLEPGEHSLILGGKGTLEYIIMVNLDWDGDLLSDVEEIQKDDLYNFKLDPMVADIWGYYERSDEFILSSKLEGTNLLEGTFTFYLPENQNINLLSIMVNSGVFKNMTIDGNSTVFQNKIFNSCASCQPDSEIFGEIDPSWHQINYKYKADNTSKVDFLINKEKIKVIKISEFKDTDGDGIKDLVEFSNGLASTKTDTDEDGIPDNFDGSPLAKLELNPLQLNQIVVPTDPNKDTIINLQVKKPNIDYSTNGVPRSWRDSFNVSIFPVLRMFGNKKDYDNPDIDDDLTLFRTNYRWRGQGEAVNHHYGPNEFFNSMKVGDPLPKPSDPNSEVHFIFANPSEFSLGYSIQIPKGHGSKNDNFIDFRFDFIWLITKYESKTDEHSILHYYDFEENIILQSMVMREISNISYILANPDGLIENQVLWALLQNPKLGNPEEFGVSDDVVGSGTVNYFGLNTQLKLDRKNNPLEANETEVLYIAGSYQNLDILNKIQLKTIPNPDFAILHQGDFEAFFSSYSISNLYENQSYVVNDPDIQGENKLLYLKYYSNDTENVGTGQERLNIINFPIALDVNANSKVVTISQAQGSNLLFEEMPYSINKLSDKITLRHQTYIECAVQNPGVPIIYFQKEVDILKEFLEKPHTNTDLTQTELEQLSTFIAGFWHQIDSIEGNLTALYELASSIQLLNEQQRVDLERIEGILNEIDDFKQFSYSKLDDYEDFFSFSYELSQDLSIIETFFLSNTNFMPVLVVLSENLYAINDLYVSIIESQAGFLKKARLASKRWRNFGEKPVFLEARSEIFTMKQNNIKNIRRAGWVTAFLGIVILFLEVAAIKDLYDNKDNYDETEFGLRITSGILGIALATLITVQGITVVIKAASIAKGVASTSLQWIGGFAAVLAVVIWVIDLVLMFKTDSWDEWDKVYDFCLNTALLGAVLIGIVSSGPLVVLAVAVLTWVFIHDLLGGLIFNRPDIEIMDDTEFFFLLHVEENIRRHGGLEIGDTVSLSLV
ncbi:MAG: hypothetical protein GY870_13090, partial [archaeon]|nr:hypothetical protein [archaeon]